MTVAERGVTAADATAGPEAGSMEQAARSARDASRRLRTMPAALHDAALQIGRAHV